jgi:hypothetical protein
MFEHFLEALVFWLLALISGVPDKINLQQRAACGSIRASDERLLATLLRLTRRD